MPKVLVITVNDQDAPLRLAEELRAMQRALGQNSSYVIQHLAEARANDLILRLLDDCPDILHFAGHGYGGDMRGLSLRGDNGKPVVLYGKDIDGIFSNLPMLPKLIFMNACYSKELADLMRKYCDVVIGVAGEIDDNLAVKFCENFYLALPRTKYVKNAFYLAMHELNVSARDQVHLDMSAAGGGNELIFYGYPEIYAEFNLNKNGMTKIIDKHYSILLSMRGVDQNVNSVFYQICDDSFSLKYRYWEIHRSESPSFETYKFLTTGDVTIRATAWTRERGSGVESTLVDALKRFYGPSPSSIIASAIDAVAKS